MSKRNGLLLKLGQNIRRAREAKELSQEKLAERASLDATYISGIERGLRNPGIKNIPGSPKRSGSPRRNFAEEWTREREAQNR